MKLTLVFLVSLVVPTVFAGHEESDRLQQKLSFEKVTGRHLEIDNIEGDIIVEGYAGDEVVLDVHKTIYAETESALAEAKREVSLEIDNRDNRISLYVDGPFRDEMWGRRSSKRRHLGYHVSYDFKLKVPHDLSLKLSTVNDGVVRLSQTNGDFEISNVNGAIKVWDVDGSGSATTVNGGVVASFVAVPERDVSFKTINGDLDITYPEHLGADLHLKTFNGEMMSDFEPETLPLEVARKTQSNGLTRLEGNKYTRVRVGGGGPKILCDTLNGDILIRKKGRS